MPTIADLTPTDLTVEPGGQTSTTIRVRNTGSIVDRFDIDIVGVTGWVRVEPPSLSLFPGAQESAVITFTPPRASTPRAGTLPFGVRVRPAADPAGSTVEEGHVTVTPFSAATADITPQSSRGSRGGHHVVFVDNRGNAPVEVVVAALDPDARLGFSVNPQRAVVAPEERVPFGLGVRVDDPFLMGQARSRPFQVNVEPGRQAPIQLRATLNQTPVLPGWLPPLGGLVALALAAVGLSFLAGAGPFAPKATPTAIAQLPSSGPTAEATSAAPSAAAASDEASAAPTASPTPAPFGPKDFTLAVTGDQGELSSDLQLVCPKDNTDCRDAAKDDMLAMLGSLQNQYTGVGITSTRSVSAANSLPIVLSSKRQFPWTSANGQTGVTQKAVVDLGPLLANPASFAYVVVNTPDGLPHRFVIDAALAKQLFDRFYSLPAGMPTIVAVTPSPGIIISDPVFAQPIWDRSWLLAQPLISPNP